MKPFANSPNLGSGKGEGNMLSHFRTGSGSERGGGTNMHTHMHINILKHMYVSIHI
jgi:hypothetical protein